MEDESLLEFSIELEYCNIDLGVFFCRKTIMIFLGDLSRMYCADSETGPREGEKGRSFQVRIYRTKRARKLSSTLSILSGFLDFSI